MAIKPILFNTEMVRAILDGRKDATRRIVKGFIPDDAVWGYTAFTPKGYISCRGTFADGYGEKFFKLPCEPGDILYVRETWHKYTKRIGKGESCRLAEFCGYKASVANSEDAEEPWHPSIRMPKEAARIWLKVTDVRVERLQEITEDGAKAEGAIDNRGFIHSPENEYDRIYTAREHFTEIWNSTIKKSDLDRYGWDANPYVFVIEFERCEKPEGV
nr:MAG TPA: ASCH domain protein [Caudoviricetes sp.]